MGVGDSVGVMVGQRALVTFEDHPDGHVPVKAIAFREVGEVRQQHRVEGIGVPGRADREGDMIWSECVRRV